ncbi:hypothetical protein [Curtobacterium sp. MCBD17_003]|uniref:hypothetical protein n=1 Tax=Curtobacterium sp. MCBD17_003 TaxID=2175667 RepID=UPI0011B76B1C|nr:hypothetical protein [Curtobacterium sp. MCBD17_003]WIE54214.1 hypothetical protein DEI88_013980 [Curtobacterium sp. MCBD17_003]
MQCFDETVPANVQNSDGSISGPEDGSYAPMDVDCIRCASSVANLPDSKLTHEQFHDRVEPTQD